MLSSLKKCLAADLRFNLLPNSSKGGCSVDILSVHHLRYIQKNEGFAMDEAVQKVLLKGWKVIRNVLTLPHDKRVAAMGEDDGGKLLFIGEEVTAMDMCDGDLVLPPLRFAVEKKKSLLSMAPAQVVGLTSGIVQ